MAGKGLGTYYKGQYLCLSMLTDPVYCVLWRKFAINYALKIKLSHCSSSAELLHTSEKLQLMPSFYDALE